MKILVTCGMGFLGSHVVEALKPVHDVDVVDDMSTGDERNIVYVGQFFRGTVREFAAMHTEDNNYDVVIHCAAQVSVPKSWQDPAKDIDTNVCQLVELIMWGKFKRLIFISSGGALYPNVSNAADCLQPKPMTPYGFNKLTAEKWVEMLCTDYVIIRPANIFGERQSGSAESGIAALIEKHLTQGTPLTIHGDGEQARDFVYVKDVVSVILSVLEKSPNGVVSVNKLHVGTGVETSVNALIGYAGLTGKVEYDKERFDMVRTSSLSPWWIRELFSWKPTVTVKDYLERVAQSAKVG